MTATHGFGNEEILVNGVPYKSYDIYLRETHGDPNPCFVYLCKCAPLTYKIGWSVDVDRRLRRLQSTRDYPLKMVVIIKTSRYGRLEPDLEGIIHRELSKKKICGEWFMLNDDDIFDLIARHGGSLA